MRFLVWLILCAVAWPLALAWALAYLGLLAWVWYDVTRFVRDAEWHGAHVGNDGRRHS